MAAMLVQGFRSFTDIISTDTIPKDLRLCYGRDHDPTNYRDHKVTIVMDGANCYDEDKVERVTRLLDLYKQYPDTIVMLIENDKYQNIGTIVTGNAIQLAEYLEGV